MNIRKNAVWFLTSLLVAAEQSIKLYINGSYLESFFPIIGHFLYFKPTFNRHYSWFNSMLELGVSKWAHIAVVAVMLFFIILFYRFLAQKGKNSGLVTAAFSFIMAGAACSLIDKVFWDGSLDYIMARGLFTFDLKDVYINVFIGLVILMMIKNHQNIRNVNERKVLRLFADFLRGK